MSIASSGRAPVVSGSRHSRQLLQALALAAVAGAMGVGSVARADTYANTNGTALNASGSWVDLTNPANMAVPGPADIAAWDSHNTNATATTYTLGVDTGWLGILIQNPTAAVTIGVGSNLTLGVSGIDMSAATQNLTIAAPLILGADQTWNVTSGRTLASTGGVTATSNLTFTGAGTTAITGVISGAGSLTVNGTGNVSVSGINTYTGGTFLNSGQLLINSNVTTLGSGGIVFSNGTLTNNYGTGATQPTFSNISVLAGGTATINMGTRMIVGGTGTAVSSTGAATLNLVANTNVSRDDLKANYSGFTGTVNISGTGGVRGFINGGSFGAGLPNATVNFNGTVDFQPQNNTPGNTLLLGALGGTSATATLEGSNTGGAMVYSVGGLGLSTTFAGIIKNNTGPAALTVTGGSLALTGANTYTGNTSISAGATLQIGSNTASGTLTSTNVINNGSLAFARSDTYVNSSVISGAGTVTQTGPGVTSLTGLNTYSGGTTINGGTLRSDNATSGTGTGVITINANGTLGGIGAVTGDVTSNGHIAPGDGVTVGTLNLGNVTMNSGSAADFNFSATANSIANLTGALTINGGGVDLYQAGTTAAFTTSGTYTLFNFANPAGLPANFTSLTVLNGLSNLTYTFGSTGSAITLTIGGGSVSTAWAVDADGSWGTAGNWTNGIPQHAGDTATLGSIITSSRTITLDGNRSVGTLVFNNGNAYTIAQGTTGSLILDNGAGIAPISDLLGTHVISAPVIFNSNTTVTTTNGGDSITLSGGTSGAGNVTVNGPGALILASTNTGTGSITIASNSTLSVGNGGAAGGVGAVSVINNGTFTFNRTGGTTIAPLLVPANITGAGTLNFNGVSVRQLTGTNTFTGPINLNGGTLQLGSATALGAGSATNVLSVVAGATLDLDGQNSTVGSITGAGTIDNTSTTFSMLTTGISNASPTFSGTIQNTGTGTLALVKVGTGSMTLNTANTYSGGTTVTGGSITVANNAALGSGPVTVGTIGGIQLNDGINLPNNLIDNVGANEIVGTTGNATLSGNITTIGSTQYRMGSGGTLVLTGASTVGYTTTTSNVTVNTSLLSFITRGNVIFAGNGSLTNLFQAVTVGRSSATATANLTLQDNAVVQGVGITLGGDTSGNDDATVTVTLTGNATMSAGTSTFNLNNSNTTGSITLTAAGNSTLKAGSFSQIGLAQGTTTVSFDGGTILATAGDTTTAFFPALGRPVNANGTVAALPLAVNILAGGLKVNDGGFAITIAQPLLNGTGGAADGGLIKSGTGALALNGINTYTGNTVVNAGTLAGTGTIAGTVVGGSAAHRIAPGTAAGSVGTLTVGGLTTNTNTTLALDLGSPDAGAAASGTLPNGTSDLLAAGNITLGGGSLAITAQTSTGNLSLGYYKAISYSGTLTGSISNITLPAVANNIEYTLDATRDPGYIDIHRGYIGDANDSGSVDVADLQIVLNNLGTTTSSWSLGNFDGAATIDLNDLNAVLNHLGTSIPTGSAIVAEAEALVGASPAATPEPASLGLLALGAAALVTRRRKV